MSVHPGFCDLGFAKLDIDRKARRGFPEVLYCPGKDRAHLKKIARDFAKHNQDLFLTKLEKGIFLYLKKSFPRLRYNPLAKIGYLIRQPKVKTGRAVLLLTAGTSDIPVAEEAVVALEAMGSRVIRNYDVGVAGVHRLLNKDSLKDIQKARVIIVIAGMEGALASIVSGLASCPVIAVPTSCGYGANFQGLAALLAMLNSCSLGVTVVNIDNGFGAGYFAGLINRL